jgi:hypothetical protein
MDDIARAALPDRHLQRVQNEFGAQMTRHRPTNDLPAPGVQHDREIQEPGRRRHEGDVGDPEFIPTHGGEITIHQIRRRSRVLVTARRRHTFSAATGTRQPGATHQARDPLAAVPASRGPKLGVDPR